MFALQGGNKQEGRPRGLKTTVWGGGGGVKKKKIRKGGGWGRGLDCGGLGVVGGGGGGGLMGSEP